MDEERVEEQEGGCCWRGYTCFHTHTSLQFAVISLDTAPPSSYRGLLQLNGLVE